jgi:hypothetical protein
VVVRLELRVMRKRRDAKRAGMVACRLGGGRSYLKDKDIVISLYLLAMLISMRAVNITRLVRAYVKEHPPKRSCCPIWGGTRNLLRKVCLS